MFSSVRRYFQARALQRSADAFYRQGQFAEAVAAYQDVLRLRPNAATIRLNLGLALYKSGRKREGRDEWRTVLAQVENTNSYLTEQVQILLRQFG